MLAINSMPDSMTERDPGNLDLSRGQVRAFYLIVASLLAPLIERVVERVVGRRLLLSDLRIIE